MRQTTQLLATALLCVSTAHAQTPAPSTYPNRTMLPPTATRPMQSAGGTVLESATQSIAPPSITPSPGGAPIPEELVTFDDRLVELQWQGGRWQIWAGGTILKDFGRRETDARHALSLIRELHLTQRGTVGTPRTIMEYWLADGHAPSGMLPGLRTTPIDQANLHVEQAQGYWCVRDRTNTFFNFGGHREEAERALAIMKKHGFEKLGFVGQNPPTMLVFLGGLSGFPTMQMHAPPPPAGRMVLPRRTDSTSLPLVDAQPNLLPPSHLHPSTNLTQATLPNADEAMKKGATPHGVNTSGTPIPIGRQLAAPSEPSPDFSTLAERVPLNYREVRLVHDQRDWKLQSGNYVIANFGANEREAQLGEMAFRTSRFTEQCLIGHPKPVFSYFLVNGRPPMGLPLGAQGINFRPQDLTLRQVKGVWAICEAARPLFAFGDKSEEAKETLKAIQKYGFDSFCQLGQGEQAMTILARMR